MDDAVLEAIKVAKKWMAQERPNRTTNEWPHGGVIPTSPMPSSREAAMVVTKLDEAAMWRERQLKNG